MSDLLTLAHVDVGFATDEGTVSAVSDVSLTVEEGEIFGLVGESGCGKTTLAMALMGLLPQTASVAGSVRFGERELFGLEDEQFRQLRGDRISMIFQDPMTSLDPTFSIGGQVAETITAHRDVSKQAARERALELLSDVGIPEAERRYDDPPHRLSGGMRQRVVIATALDVTIQSQVLDLLRDLRKRLRTTIVLITHDLGVVAQICDRVGVMYAGQLVEVAPVAEIFRSPSHPYTQALLAALPSEQQEPGSLRVIGGRVPNLTAPPPGCRFSTRCPYVMDVCANVPPLAHETDDHLNACWLSEATKQAAEHEHASAGGAA